MTMTQANQAIQNFEALKLQHKAFVEEIEPFKNSFYTFLSQNLHLSKWMDFNITYDGPTMEADDFELDLNNTALHGVLFVCEASEIDGPVTLYFNVPFAYMTKPEEWMEHILTVAAKDQKTVEDAYNKVAPGIREELQLDIHINSIETNGQISAVVCEKGNTGLTLGHPETHKMVMNSFAVDYQTGEITYRRLI